MCIDSRLDICIMWARYMPAFPPAPPGRQLIHAEHQTNICGIKTYTFMYKFNFTRLTGKVSKPPFVLFSGKL